MIAWAVTRDVVDAAAPALMQVRRSALLRYVMIASALGLAWGVTEVLTHAADIVRSGSFGPALWFLALDFSTAYWVILLILIANRVPVSRWPWWTPYVAALLLGGVIGQVAETLLFQWWMRVPSLSEAFTPDAWRVRPLIEYLGYLVYCLPAALMYAYLRRIREQSTRLHALQSTHASLRRNLVESRLQSMQTQLEPEDLFATLERIEALSLQDPERSLRALDALIGYLRCGVTRSTNSRSTLRREIAIAGAWLELRRELSGAAPSLRVTINGAADDAELPAMILRPLIQYAGESAPASTDRLDLHATIAPPVLRLELRGVFLLTMGMADSDNLERLRERIAMLYPGHGQLTCEVQSSDGMKTTRIVAEIPYERADGIDR